MAGVKRFEATLAIGATTENLLAGSFLERLGARAELVSVYGVIPFFALASNSGLFVCDVRMGNVIAADRAAVPQVGTAATDITGPDRDKHLLVRAVGAPFDLVQIRLFNGSTVAVPFRFLVEMTPL